MVAEAGLSDRITVKTVNVLDKLLEGDFDIAMARALFQVLSADQCRTIARNIGAGVAPGGTLFVIGFITDDSRLSPENCVGMNMNFLNQYDDGEAYTESEYRNWLGEAGFADIMREPFLQGMSLMLATKA